MKSFSGYWYAKIFETLAKLPGEQIINVIINSLPLLLRNEQIKMSENLTDVNLGIIESVAKVPEIERHSVVFQTLNLCKDEHHFFIHNFYFITVVFYQLASDNFVKKQSINEFFNYSL